MTRRQKKIWDLLAEHKCLTSAQIARQLHISDRTVRSDIKEINQENGQEVIQAVKGQGYSVKGPLPAAAGYPDQADGLDDLEWQIVRRVLFEAEVPYLELADELYISDAFLSKLIGRINSNMSRKYGHERWVIRKQNGLLVLRLPEWEKREYYHFYVTSRNLNHYYDWREYQPFFDYVELEQIEGLVLAAVHGEERHFYDTTIMRLMIHTAILAERWACGFLLEDSGNGRAVEQVQGEAPAWRVLDGIKDLISLEQEIPGEEYCRYETIFQNDFYYIKDGNLEQTRELLHKILIEVSVEYGFDFTGNKEFCDEMTAQLNGTQIRARKKQDVINPVLAQIKFKYPLEYDIAIFFADRFHRLTGLNVSEDEVGQFAVHFIWGMETGFEKMQQKLVLINPFGKQTNELMEKRLQKIGECHPVIAYQYSVFDYPRQMPMDAVALLTTTPLASPPEDIPVVLCRNFLDYHEKEKLLTIIRESQVTSIKSYFRMLFKPSLFFSDMEFESREDVLAFMSRQLCEQGYVGDGFFDSVMQREIIAPTAFEPGFAFSHGMENNAYRTAVCTCILKNKISWGPYQVKIVFLFALAASWNHTIIPVYNVMIDHLFQSSTIHRLSKIKDCQVFLDYLL